MGCLHRKSRGESFSSMALSTEVPVFSDTNLGTRLAMAVSPEITAGGLKRELEKEHYICFPDLGEIRVHSLTVKRKSCFYHIPDLVPMKNAFQGLSGSWFLRVEASPMCHSDKPCLSEGLVAELSDCVSEDSSVIDYQKSENPITIMDKKNIKHKSRKRGKRFRQLEDALKELLAPVYIAKKKKRLLEKHFQMDAFNGTDKVFLGATKDGQCLSSRERFGHLGRNEGDHGEEEWTSQPMIESIQTMSSSEVVSVTGIIGRYFPEFDEVNQFDTPSSHGVINHFGSYGAHQVHLDKPFKLETDEYCSKVQAGNTLQYTTKTPPTMCFLPLAANPSIGVSRGELGRTDVGKRLILASNNLGISVCPKKPAISIGRSKGGKSLVTNSCSLVRSLVFDVSDGDN